MYRVARNAVFTAAAATLLIAQPAMATRSASSLPSPQAARTASPVDESEDLRGGFIIPLIALIAIILGILAATSGGDNDSPG
jgi:hypothetical protein